ncbi:MAG: hypothetical protein ACLFM7_12530 [Bacteroidales bacterium]
MKKRNVCQKIQHAMLVVAIIPMLSGGCQKPSPEVGWPEINRETKP